MGLTRKAIFDDKEYIGRYSWIEQGGFPVVMYVFVNGKGRKYLQNYRKVRDFSIKDYRSRGFTRMILPFRKSHPEKISFVKYFLRPLVKYGEDESFVYFYKELGG